MLDPGLKKVKAKAKLPSPLPAFHTGGTIGVELGRTELITLYTSQSNSHSKISVYKDNFSLVLGQGRNMKNSRSTPPLFAVMQNF